VPLRNGTGVEYYDHATNNMVICGVASVPSSCGIFDQSRLHFVPRLGIAYRLGSSTVIRAGFGMSTDPANIFAVPGQRRINFPYIIGVIQLPPNVMSYALTLRQGITIPANPFPLTTGKVPVPSTAGLFDYNAANYKRGYVETYNFTVEQRIRPGWTASAGYAGSQQKDPMNSLEENWSPIGTGTAGLLLNNAIDQRIASTPLLGTFGSVNYNALQARMQGRFSSGLT